LGEEYTAIIPVLEEEGINLSTNEGIKQLFRAARSIWLKVKEDFPPLILFESRNRTKSFLPVVLNDEYNKIFWFKQVMERFYPQLVGIIGLGTINVKNIPQEMQEIIEDKSKETVDIIQFYLVNLLNRQVITYNQIVQDKPKIFFSPVFKVRIPSSSIPKEIKKEFEKRNIGVI